MPRPRANLIKRAERWVQNSYGDLTHAEYQLFLTVRDVPSIGRCHRIVSWTAGRIHHLFSDLEAKAFYIADYSASVSDIREQYPLLPLEETLEIADMLGVSHPAFRGKFHVMTTDLLLSRKENELVPIFIKYSKDLESKRVIEKLEIERVYWKRRHRQLRVMTELDIPLLLSRAVNWVHCYREPEGLINDPEVLEQIFKRLDFVFQQKTLIPLAKICFQIDLAMKLELGQTLSFARVGIAQRRWRLDLRKGIDTLKPLPWLEE